MSDRQQHEQQQPQDDQDQQQQQTGSTADADANRMKRVILIRLPAGQQTPLTANSETSPIPPNLINHIVNNELRNSGIMATQGATSTTNTTTTATAGTTTGVGISNNNNNNNDMKPMADTSANPGDLNSTTTTSGNTGTPSKRGSGDKGEDAANYKNYSPKQREWMLVYLGYARGLLNKEFEERLPDAIIQKTNQILMQRGKYCNINRIPSSKTLRAVWKNLWKEERTVATIIKKGGRPRIDPVLKREKRNERERRKRAAAREMKAAMKAGSGGRAHRFPERRSRQRK